MKEKSRLIFGGQPWSPVSTGNKVLRRKLRGPLLEMPNAKPFKDIIRKEFPDFLDEKEERRAEKLIELKKRGKGPPKKGQGRRAAKRGGKK